MTVKSSAKVGYLNAILAQGGGNLNNSIFKSSNARGLPGGGGGMLMFRIDRRISSAICFRSKTSNKDVKWAVFHCNSPLSWYGE